MNSLWLRTAVLSTLLLAGVTIRQEAHLPALHPPADSGAYFVSGTPAPPPTPTAALPLYAPLTSTPTASLPLYTPPPPTPTATLLPRQSRVRGLPRRGQRFSLSCEAHIAVTLAAWYGVSISEEAFQAALPHSDNPEIGFVGDVHGPWGSTPPDDYGVHAPPVAALLRAYGVPARARHGMTWQELRAEVAAGRPVGVWVIGHVGNGVPRIYRALDGSLVTVGRFEHTVIVIGYAPGEVLIQDGAGIYTRSTGDFLRSWSVLGNMALTLEAPPP